MPATTPLEYFLKWEKQKRDQVYLSQPIGGKWYRRTWGQAGDEARRLAAGLYALGCTKGTHVALLSKNCAEWIISDLAIMMAGCVSVPLYPTLSSGSIEPILLHSESKAVIIGKLDDYQEQQQGIPADITRIGMKTYGIDEQYAFEDLVSNNEPLSAFDLLPYEEVMTIIYTSGTTGNSKGVMHTASAFDTTLQAGVPFLDLPMGADLFSYLPLSHIAERLGLEMVSFYTGSTLSFAESIEKFPKNLAEVQPHSFFAVPRIWTKIREGVLTKISQKKLDLLLSLPVINSGLKRTLKKKLGFSRTEFFASGAAPLSVEIQEWFSKIGINICQVYGMTEDCCYSHFNTRSRNRFGTVGPKLPGLETRIAEDGEIRVKSTGNMKGYYKEPELTARVFDQEEYLKTGDIGEYDADGFLRITGRVKDIFKTDKGKYISPAPIETKLLVDPDIEYACVVGTGVPHPIGLICISESGLRKSKPDLAASLENTLAFVNTGLENFEKLGKLVIMKNAWSIANGRITPSLKVRRNEIEKEFLPEYPQWYKKEGIVIWD